MGNSTSVAYVVGAFDMLNVAHLSVISQVRERCSTLVVAVLSDDQVTSEFGRAPVMSVDDRVEIVSHLRDVDDVVVHDPAWLQSRPAARVYALSERSDVVVDEIVRPLDLPANDVLWGAISRTVDTVVAS